MRIPGLRRAQAQWDVRAGRSWWRRLTAPQLFVSSFLLLIVFGTLGLRLLPGMTTGQTITWIDALFTATSAVCVTGLTVVDTATFFTPAGHAFILLLIQLGGLGMVSFSTIIILALGRKLSLRTESVTSSLADVAPHIDYRHLARSILLFTFTFELLGAMLLLFAWTPRLGFVRSIWPAVFHSISAFCNAGFSTFPDSLMSFDADGFTLITIMLLIVVGGIGFLTIEELYVRGASRRVWQRRSTDELVPRLSLHSRLALGTTAVLIIGGGIFFTATEWNLSFAGMPNGAKLLNALFMSVTARTAGFNAIDYGQASDAASFGTILLMFIGGSPGSTAGGVKTTTFAVIGLLALARYRGDLRTSVFGRTIPDETIQRAVGLFVIAFGLITVAIFVLTTTEIGAVSHPFTQGKFLALMFEATSAFNTVGLTMGVTPELTTPGRIVCVLLMYLGRVGPLTFAAAIALRRGPGDRQLRYAYEDVVIG
jgi:trk system potassium uptake protein